MSERLEEALQAHRSEVEQALAAAEEELSTLNVRRRELEELIERARATLGLPELPSAKALTLHEAIERVLLENHNQWMDTKDIAHHVNRQGLYRRGDGAPVDTNQIAARINNYPHMFERQGSSIRVLLDEEVAG